MRCNEIRRDVQIGTIVKHVKCKSSPQKIHVCFMSFTYIFFISLRWFKRFVSESSSKERWNIISLTMPHTNTLTKEPSINKIDGWRVFRWIMDNGCHWFNFLFSERWLNASLALKRRPERCFWASPWQSSNLHADDTLWQDQCGSISQRFKQGMKFQNEENIYIPCARLSTLAILLLCYFELPCLHSKVDLGGKVFASNSNIFFFKACM